MTNTVYFESSVIGMSPKTVNFLGVLVNKAKEAKDYVLSMKQKDIANITGKDVRTVSRYLTELEKNKVITMKGRRGREGGTVIVFNPELIKFEIPEKALINPDNDDIEKIMEERLPKKVKEPKEKKRNRRTKQQILEEQILENNRKSEIKRLNDELNTRLGGIPDWEWFEKTGDPIGNYRTYLLSRLYNRYAALFVDYYNAEVKVYGEGVSVPRVSNDYDVLPKWGFYGSPRWNQFEKLRKFCEENNIEVASYLSALFSRAMFNLKNTEKPNPNKMLPFVNSLVSEQSIKIYKEYCDYYKQSISYISFKTFPVKFAGDFAVSAIIYGYDNAHRSPGLLFIKGAVNDFMNKRGSLYKEQALADFINITDKNLRDMNVTLKTRNTIKKYLLLQSMAQTNGRRSMPPFIIIASDFARATLMALEHVTSSVEEANDLKSKFLGSITLPHMSAEEQYEQGEDFRYQLSVLKETPDIMRLILKRLGLYVSIQDVREALKEYGKDKIPVTPGSMLDVKQVIEFMEQNVYHETLEEWEERETVDLEAITSKSELAPAHYDLPSKGPSELDRKIEEIVGYIVK